MRVLSAGLVKSVSAAQRLWPRVLHAWCCWLCLGCVGGPREKSDERRIAFSVLKHGRMCIRVFGNAERLILVVCG